MGALTTDMVEMNKAVDMSLRAHIIRGACPMQ